MSFQEGPAADEIQTPSRQAPTFEEAQRELESIVGRLESGQVPLEEAIALWERGEELYRLCRARLDAAQGRIEELAKQAEAQQT